MTDTDPVTILASQIYVRVIKDRILGAPKTWVVPEKQAKAIAQACLAAAQTFYNENAVTAGDGS